MPNDYSRHLAPLFKYVAQEKERFALKSAAPDQLAAPSRFEVPEEFNGKDYLSFLLHIDAELEHGLMLQYLYAAYSLGGPQIPEEYREKVRGWQEIILGIAKEEMGHFISVQNVLRLIGAPLNFGRQDYPWDTPFYPFPFKLEPLTLDSLAKYVYAESPEGWIDSDDPIAKEIKKILETEDHGDPVGVLFQVILQLIEDTTVVPDTVFQAQTYPFQAKFDEWGRGYAGGQRGNTTKAHQKGAPDVLVVPLASRDDAYNALEEIAEQGEAQKAIDNDGQPSHFDRFLKVYKELREVKKQMPEGWEASRKMAVNPYVDPQQENPDSSPSEGQTSDQERDLITNPEAALWANLFNVRYRMLLTFLTHSFLLKGGYNNTGSFTPRGTIINSTFGEMYNLRSIANVLVQTPIAIGSDKMAGPPFLIPYSLELPIGEHNRWRLHQDLIQASARIITQLEAITTGQNKLYLNSLKEADQKLMDIIRKLTDTVLT